MENIIDQTELAKDVADKISFEFVKDFLIKPLPADKVMKEITTPVEVSKDKVVDENNIEAVDYETKTETKEVDSNFRKGVVLKVPFEYSVRINDTKLNVMPIKVGDIVLYRGYDNPNMWFDLVKDTQLVAQWDVLGKVA